MLKKKPSQRRPDKINSKSPEKFGPPQWISLSDINHRSSLPPKAAGTSVSVGTLIQRDLSWLHFNDRVLSEAADRSVPPLERLRFAGIVSSNLNEFFMVRVAELTRKAKRHRVSRSGNKFTNSQILAQIRDHVLRQKSNQAIVFEEILEVLGHEGIVIHTDFNRASKRLDREIKENLPEIKFIVRPSAEPLPPLLKDHIYVFVRFSSEFAVLSIEEKNAGNRSARLLRFKPKGKQLQFALVERWLSAKAQDLFPDREVIESFPFKIIRDADLRYRPDDEGGIEDQIVEAVQGLSKAKVIRLEVDAPTYSEGALFLATRLGLDSAALYRFDMPLDLRTLGLIYKVKSFNRLRYPPVRPQTPPPFSNPANVFDIIRKRDILLHHPYDSFDVIVRFLRKAARDPHVTHITHTMYRTSRESPIMEALKEGVKRGKKVTAYIEVKARFDELNNIYWAKELREAGVRVVRSLGRFKVHCKLTQVMRQENGKPVSYLHLGTGNYHPGTALQYTDLGLLTSDPVLGQDISNYFTSIAKQTRAPNLKDILVAPTNLHSQFEKLIQEETRIQREGGKGHIIAKMNSLVDPRIIKRLYEASQAGVRIRLIVRGICCLRPGVKGISENIRVTSVIDRFLEHSRVYYFRAGGAKKIYLSSADWMPRNFKTRYEIAFPIKDPLLKRYIREVVLATSLADNVKAWTLKSDGTYERMPRFSGRQVRSQFVFEELAKNDYEGTVLAGRKI